MPLETPGRGAFARCGQGGPRAPRRGVFRSPKFYGSFVVSGVTRDSAGVALGGCLVAVFNASNVQLGQTISDGAGAFSIPLGGNGAVYLVAYKAGAPDVAGTTVNTLTPSPA